MDAFSTLMKRIETRFGELSPQLQRAARYVLDHPEEIGLHSMRRVAELAGVTPTTLVRFAREMDCDGYAAFRRPFKAYLSRRSRGYADRAHDLRLRSGGVVGEMLRDIVVADQTNVERTLLGAGPERLDRVVDMIAKARRVYIIGLRKCYPIAHYLHYAYSVFRNNGYLVTDFAGTLPDQLKELGPDDVMLAISITRYSRQTVRCASFAASRGAKVIALTDSAVSPLVPHAAERLILAHDTPSVFRSLTGALSLAQALIVLLIVHDGDDAEAAIRAMEAHLDAFETFEEQGTQWS